MLFLYFSRQRDMPVERNSTDAGDRRLRFGHT
jgi:hypothetical protein